MKKTFLIAGVALFFNMAASAQNKKKAPPPPPPPMVELVDEAPPPPPPPPKPPKPPKVALPADYKAFLERNPSVKSLGWNKQHEVIIRLKSGGEERYRLDDEKSRKVAEEKYGKLPAPPPPPPPLPPVPPPPPAAPDPEQ